MGGLSEINALSDCH